MFLSGEWQAWTLWLKTESECMKVSTLIELLKEAQKVHGDLPIRFVGGEAEYTPNSVVLTRAHASAVHPGSLQGAHTFQPDRLVIKSDAMPS